MITDRKYTFIIIDDHPFIRDGIRNYVTAHKCFEFIGDFPDTRSVLNSNFSGKPDVIILDLSLPGIDGEKSFPLLKRKYPLCKIVAFTQREGQEKELKKIGFDGYILKNERDSLVDALRAVLNGDKYFTNNSAAGQVVEDPGKIDTYSRINQLTPREMEVAKHMREDFSNREIAEITCISEDTVKTHRKHVKEKLGVKSKRELYLILRSIDFTELL